MKISNSLKEAGKQAVQSLWDDKLSVKREQDSGNVCGFIEVYKDITCHLCGSEPTMKQGSEVATADTKYSVHVDGVEIHAGDQMEVIHQGRVYKGAAGIPFPRSFCIVVPMTGVVIA